MADFVCFVCLLDGMDGAWCRVVCHWGCRPFKSLLVLLTIPCLARIPSSTSSDTTNTLTITVLDSVSPLPWLAYRFTQGCLKIKTWETKGSSLLPSPFPFPPSPCGVVVSLPPSVSDRARQRGISAAEDSGLTLLVGVVFMDDSGEFGSVGVELAFLLSFSLGR